MPNTSRLQILLLAASVAAGCAGPQTSAALFPEPSQPSALVASNAGADGVDPDAGIGSARFYLHNTESCGHIASDEMGNEWYGVCDHWSKAWLAEFNESTHSFAVYRLPREYQSPGDIARP